MIHTLKAKLILKKAFITVVCTHAYRPGVKVAAQRQAIFNAMKARSNLTYLSEIHGGGPGLDLFGPFIEQLRNLCELRGKSVFVFTSMREPVAFLESYFRFSFMSAAHGRGARKCTTNMQVNKSCCRLSFRIAISHVFC